MSSRLSTAQPRSSDSVRVAGYVAMGLIAGLFAGLVAGLFLAIPLAQVIAGGRDLALSASFAGGIAGALGGYRLAAGRAEEPRSRPYSQRPCSRKRERTQSRSGRSRLVGMRPRRGGMRNQEWLIHGNR